MPARLNIVLTDDEHAAFRAVADARGTSQADTLRRWIAGASKRLGKPPAPRPRRGCQPGDEACTLGLTGGRCSLPAPLYLPQPSGPPRRVPSRYCVTEAEALQASHLPAMGFRKNPAYPLDAQERRYDTDPGERLKVEQLAENLTPDLVFLPAPTAIDGPPVVTQSGIVLGGNGRTMGLQLHYARGHDAARSYLVEHAPAFGLRRAAVERLKHPVVVRVVGGDAGDPARLAAWSRKLNEAMTQGLDARAIAVSQARQVDRRALEVLANTLDPDETLAAYLASERSRTLVYELRRLGLVSDRNASAVLTAAGLLNDDGRQLVERTLVALLVPDADLLDALGPQARSTLARATPSILATASADPAWDARPAVLAALRDLVRMRESDQVRVAEYLAQGGLFAASRPVVDGIELGPLVLAILWELVGHPVKLATLWRAYAEAALRNPRGQGGLFPEAQEAPADVLRRLAQAAGVTVP